MQKAADLDFRPDQRPFDSLSGRQDLNLRPPDPQHWRHATHSPQASAPSGTRSQPFNTSHGTPGAVQHGLLPTPTFIQASLAPMERYRPPFGATPHQFRAVRAAPTAVVDPKAQKLPRLVRPRGTQGRRAEPGTVGPRAAGDRRHHCRGHPGSAAAPVSWCPTRSPGGCREQRP